MPRAIPIISAAGLCLGLALAATAQTGSRVAQTKHNLSISGPGPIRVAGATEICQFCHTPHSANPIAPLWNRTDPGTYYQTYQSPSLKAGVGQPTGSSRLCLSCHDGTIALTQTYRRSGTPADSIRISPGDAGHIGTDLSDDHPVSFVFDAGLVTRNGKLRDPSALAGRLPLDRGGQLQCTTCHDPHDDSRGKFLRQDNRASAMCLSCHLREGWATSPHATSGASVAGALADRWTNVSSSTVRDLACEGCHRPHNAGGRQYLLRHAVEEDNCLNCHNGSVAQKDLSAEFRKAAIHPIALTTGVHDPSENPASMQKHVECVDCHDPHRAFASGAAAAPAIKPSMRGVPGVTASGNAIPQAANEYEVCFKCHAGRNPVLRPLVDRVVRNNSLSEKLALGNQSYHPVEGFGKNQAVPSLLQPYKVTSIVYCTDCHGSDGPVQGPHGSNHPGLLVREYEFQNPDSTAEGPAAYALCYGCHNRNSILRDQGFSLHHKHLEKRISCSACHDPHGVQQNAHLINFDAKVAFPSRAAGNRGPTYQSLGFLRGSCTLLCHGEDHKNATYAP